MLLLIGSVSVHYAIYDGVRQEETVKRIAKVTKLSTPSFSVAYYEPRVLFYTQVLNPAYPQMQTINKMDLIYEQ
jgi:hypothetical protein